jgi:hypothetical protein
VAGSALQVAVARETALGHLGDRGAVGAAVAQWLRQLVLCGVALTAASSCCAADRGDRRRPRARPRRGGRPADRDPLAAAQRPARRAAGAATVTRRSPRASCSRRSGRLILGLVLVTAGAGVTGAYLGTPLSMLITVCALILMLRGVVGGAQPEVEPRTLRSLVSAAGRRSSASSSSPRCRTST